MASLIQIAPRRRLALTPLIDVVFLLLMFFMLTSSFDKFTTINLNLGGHTASATVAKKLTNILVRIHDKDKLDVNGEPVNNKNLSAMVLALVVAKKLQPEDIRVLLQPRTKSKSQAVVDAVFALKKIKIHNIVIVR